MDVSWVVQTATMLGIGLIGYFLKTTVTELKTQIKENAEKVSETEGNITRRIYELEDKFDKKQGKLEKELDELKGDLPFIYVTREDFIRVMNNVDTKLDKIYEFMMGRGK